MDLKKEAAKAAVDLIEGEMTIGLGAGSTIAYMVEFLQRQLQRSAKTTFITSSFSTLQLLVKSKLPVQHVASLDKIDIYFDGCDQFDRDLNALKSGGGIHTQEKLLACMAKEFILVGDDKKLVDKFSTEYPVVIEVLPQAFSYVPAAIASIYATEKMSYRTADKKDGLVVTENGNYLLDIFFTDWPEIPGINPKLKGITGVIETSVFYNIATKAIIAGETGVQALKKERAILQ